MTGGEWRWEWHLLCEKLKRDESLTLPEQRWLAFTLPYLADGTATDEPRRSPAALGFHAGCTGD